MAVTGFLLFLFLLGHLAGNLQVFIGPEAINRYGNFLQTNLELVWPVRVLLMIFLVLHIWSAITLSLANNAARPIGYAVYDPVASTYASRTMLLSGIIVFCFIVYHILHYTAEWQFVNGTGQSFATFIDPKKQHDIFKMMVVGFSNGWVSAFYILGVGLLCFHLSHGLSSMFHSVGWKTEAYRPFLDKLAPIVAAIIWIGYISIPIAILLGYGKEALK